jgi:hypothetical protein
MSNGNKSGVNADTPEEPVALGTLDVPADPRVLSASYRASDWRLTTDVVAYIAPEDAQLLLPV